MARLTERANADFLTVTELADTIAREEGVGFRDAHRLVSEAVKKLEGRYAADSIVHAVIKLASSELGRPLAVPKEVLLQALDARNFVAKRTIPGGPAREAIETAMSLSDGKSRAVEGWIEEKTSLLASYRERISGNPR